MGHSGDEWARVLRDWIERQRYEGPRQIHSNAAEFQCSVKDYKREMERQATAAGYKAVG